MKKISFEQFEKMMSYDVITNDACIEIEFCVDGFPEYSSCWLGKTVNRETNRADYWYGLVPDGSQAYNFNSLKEFISESIFQSSSIKEIWNLVTLFSIDGCDIDWRLLHYLGLEPGPIRRPARPAKI